MKIASPCITSSTRSCVALCAFVLLASCSSDGSPNGPSGACTLLGCTDGLEIAFARMKAWPAATYTIDVNIASVRSRCTVTLPLSCDRMPRCTTSGWSVLTSGCAQPAASQTITGVAYRGSEAPASVEITVFQGERSLGSSIFSPEYRVSQPNGPDCPPVCRTAPRQTLMLAL
jgi:hypothetical protein